MVARRTLYDSEGNELLTDAHPGTVNAVIEDNVGRLLGRITHYDEVASGELARAGDTVEIGCGGLGTVGLGVSGVWVGTIVAEISVGDGVWDTIPLIDQTLGGASLSTTSNANLLLGVSGAKTLRVRASAWTSGTATITFSGSAATGGTFLTRSIPTGVNNIGDVDVLTVPGALQGPGNPTVDSYDSAVVNLAASTADQELVADPGADKQIWVYGLFVMADTAAGTITLQDEDDNALSGTMAVSDEGGFVIPPSGNFAMPWVVVPTNKALEADTGAATLDGILTYAIISV